jgi:formylmethanofuran dehydrogenase subunit E
MSEDLNTNKKNVKRNWICDECGEYFIVGDEGEVTAGFGMCNKCWGEITKKV